MRYSKVYVSQTVLLLLFVFLLLIFVLSQYQSGSRVIVDINNTSYSTQGESIVAAEKLPPVSPPVKIGKDNAPVLTARAALVLDTSSRAYLYEKNKDDLLRPASTTKIMTALVALEHYHLSDIVTISHPVQEGKIMHLVEGEEITVENLLYGLLIDSANDAAFALADFYPEGRDVFVSLMNEKSKNIGLINTHFVDPAGFDNEKQYTTASDLAKLMLVALKNPTISKMISIPSITVSDVNFIYFHHLQNVNRLLGKVPGVAGGKTGWTENAKENLVNLTKRNGYEILTVVLGSDDRFKETELLTNWTFSNYIWPNSQSTTDQPQGQTP